MSARADGVSDHISGVINLAGGVSLLRSQEVRRGLRSEVEVSERYPFSVTAHVSNRHRSRSIPRHFRPCSNYERM